MRHYILHILICCISALIATTGCNYASSGTFTDAPLAWSWAFGDSNPPQGVTVNHSQYWSSAHFTEEYIWYFDLTLDANAVELILNDADFRVDNHLESTTNYDSNAPQWFLPEGADGYTLYVSPSEPSFLIYLNPDTGRSFWTKTQL